MTETAIRLTPFTDAEAYQATQKVFEHEGFVKGMLQFLPKELCDYFLKVKDEVHTIFDFQTKIIYHLLLGVQQKSITQRTSSGMESLNNDDKYLFISNHRDIVLDSAYLNALLYENHIDTSQIAIGSNLVKHPISDALFRLNKSFVVMREGTPRELYGHSVNLSKYIVSQIEAKKSSIWIAQREGRAKDGNDKTQVSLLKMIIMSNKGNLVDFLKSLKIVPAAISYEFDPCDVVKTLEYIEKLENPDFKKTFEQDLKNIVLGLDGEKGHLHTHFSKPLDEELDILNDIKSKKAQLEMLAQIIDHEIHKNYKLHSINYVAYDLIHQTQRFSDKYSKAEFEQYSRKFNTTFPKFTAKQNRLAQTYLTNIYANPVVNQLAVIRPR